MELLKKKKKIKVFFYLRFRLFFFYQFSLFLFFQYLNFDRFGWPMAALLLAPVRTEKQTDGPPRPQLENLIAVFKLANRKSMHNIANRSIEEE